jgi:putative transposase
MDKDQRLELALFHYQIIAPALDPDLKRGEKVRILRDRAQSTYEHPSLGKKKYRFETLRKWCKRYRKGGLDALFPKEPLG